MCRTCWTWKRRGEIFNPGDVIMHNDPYGGASHGPDVAFIVPVFFAGELIGFSCTTAHHLDIGALSPGSCGIVDALDVYAEGLQFKAIKAYDRASRNEPVWQILKDNIRASDMVVGDMEAQIAACRIGAERMADLAGRYGVAMLRAASLSLMQYSERLMRQAIADLARRHLQRGNLHRRLPARSRPAPARPADPRRHHGQGRRPDGRPHRHRAAGRRPADQHAPGRHRRRRHLADGALDPARQRRLRLHSPEHRSDPPDHHRRAARGASPTRSSPPPSSPASRRATSLPTR
jgi:hypothetical protein